MNREDMLSRFMDRDKPWDILVIGGGATGIGITMDAAPRGYDTLLLEQSDFGKGNSTKVTSLMAKAQGRDRRWERKQTDTFLQISGALLPWWSEGCK